MPDSLIQTNAPAAAPVATPPSEPAPLPPGRPEPPRAPAARKFDLTEDRIPEKYRSAEDPVGEFLKGFDNLNGLVGKKDEELRAALKGEIEGELFKGRPEAADKYAMPEKIDPRVDKDELAKHPLVEWWRTTAFARGLDQAGFEEGIGKYIEAMGERVPDAKKEMELLGENAKPRLEALGQWAGQTFKGDDLATVHELATTAKGVRLLEGIMRQQTGQPPAGTEDQSRDQGDDENAIQALMAKPEYYDPKRRNPAIVARVEAFFRKKYS